MHTNKVISVIGFSLFALLTACNAQKPVAGSPPTNSATSTPLGDGRKYSEPALIGKIVDAETKLPVKGALIYGFYATAKGSLAGGSQFVEAVRSFEAETDVNGQFKLDAWDTGDRAIKGEPGSNFPMIAIYKPGYEFAHQNLQSIKQWRPKSSVSGASERSDTAFDWTKTPYELSPVKTEKDRYEALSNSGVATMMIGECGWEVYAGLLLAQHTEIKGWISRNIPADQVNAKGYAKPTYFHPEPLLGGLYGKPSSVERILERYSSDTSRWKCTNPNNVFKRIGETEAPK